MVLQQDIRIETGLEENMFLFNGRLHEIPDYAFFIKLFGHLGKLNMNRDFFFDNKWDDWTRDFRLCCIHNYPLRRGVITSTPVEKCEAVQGFSQWKNDENMT